MQLLVPSQARAFGSYELERVIAEGGMGRLFEARAVVGPLAGARLVVKRLKREVTRTAEARAMLLHEARIGALLEHPNIARIYDYGEVDGRMYLAMEYVDGISLNRLLRSPAGELPTAFALSIVADIASALDYAHTARCPQGMELHIVHRDVTPHNIMISREGVVKLIDFGVAKSMGQDYDTETGVLKGKLSYMAPEQFEGKVTSRTDIFSLGVILYELVTGKRLFRRATDAETLAAILHHPMPDLDAAEVPQALRGILRRALARDPDARYARAQAFEADLREAMSRMGLQCTGADFAQLAAERLALAMSLEPMNSVTPASGVRRNQKNTYWSDDYAVDYDETSASTVAAAATGATGGTDVTGETGTALTVRLLAPFDPFNASRARRAWVIVALVVIGSIASAVALEHWLR